MESTVSPDCKKPFFFSPAKVVCVASRCAPFRLLLFVGPVFFCLCSPIFHPLPILEKRSHNFAALSVTVTEMIYFCAFVFRLILHFLLVLFLFVFGLKKIKKQTNQDRDKPAVVHAKMNCVKTKLVPLFFIFCNGLLLNISIYWYIKSDWKTLSCVLFVFVLFFCPFKNDENI